MRQFKGGSRPPKQLTQPYVSIRRGSIPPKKIDVTLCVHSCGGLDPQKTERTPMCQFLWGSRAPKKLARPYASIPMRV